MTWQTSAQIIAILAGITIAIRLSRSRSLAWATAITASLLAVSNVWSILDPGDYEILRAAIREGCLSEPSNSTSIIRALVLVLVAAFFVWWARHGTLNRRDAADGR